METKKLQSQLSKTEGTALSTVTDDEGKDASHSGELPLAKGEKIQASAREVTYLCPFSGPVRGTLFVTNYKLFFKAEDDPPFSVEVALCSIFRIEKIGGTTSRGENAYGLEISCKDMRNVRFAHKQENHSRRLVYDKLMHYAYPSSSGKNFFAFSLKEEYEVNGWEVFDVEAEFRRLVTINVP